MKSSAELKAMARGQLLGKYTTVIGAALLISIFSGVIALPINLMINKTTTIGYIVSYFLTLLLQIFLSLFIVGKLHLHLNIICNRKYNVNDIFYGFTNQPGKTMLLMIYQLLIAVLVAIPVVICFALYMITDLLFLLPVLIIVALVTIVISVIISLMFSQAFYLLVDLPRYPTIELLKISTKIMKGHKARFFYLQVSFIGLYLIGILTCGIGLYWVIPYVDFTNANFYLDLMQNYQKRATY